MAVEPRIDLAFPLPTPEEAIALQIVGEYLSQAGAHSASALLGCPPLDGETSLIAQLSNRMLSGAALCADLVELAELAESQYPFDEAA